MRPEGDECQMQADFDAAHGLPWSTQLILMVLSNGKSPVQSLEVAASHLTESERQCTSAKHKSSKY
ncbi:hypothetical protein E4U32_002117 [Claviceps aff. humidiphila group G2b]|nr:hypothetical protein E4U32_002117 [Claviceps aff. humidiphila group G2b]